MRRLALLSALLLTWPSGAPAAEGGAAPEGAAAAREVVETLHGALLAAMQESATLGFAGRYERIFAALTETFDLPLMARTSLGSAWKQLDRPQRAEFVTLSHQYSATRYAHSFDSFSGQRFETRSVSPAAHGTLMVVTELEQPQDDDVRFDYRLRRVDGRWRIIDIILDGGISELAVRRSQYRALFNRGGFPHLAESMRDKIAELSEE